VSPSSIFSEKAYNFSKNFNDYQVYLIVAMGMDGDLTWEEAAKKLNKKFLMSHSKKVYEGINRRFADQIINIFHSGEKVNPHDNFDRVSLGDIRKINKKKNKKFVITSVGLGQSLFTRGYSALKNYCKTEDAELVLLPMRAHVKALSGQPKHYDTRLLDDKHLFVTEYVLGTRIKAFELQINPQQINPLTGLNRIRDRASNRNDDLDDDFKIIEDMAKNQNKISIIVAHSKQMLQTVPTGNASLPRLIHTTGAVTLPSYRTEERIGLIAHQDHDLGALIVEINGDEFFLRQITLNKTDGSFPSMGKRYHANGKVTKERPEAFVMGDIHPGHESQPALKIWQEIWKDQSPRRIFLHDWYDGTSSSHHLKRKKLTQSKLPDRFKTIPDEIKCANKVLYTDIADKAPKDSELFLVPSNHPDFLEKYLDGGDYIYDRPENYQIAHRMVVNVLDGGHHLKPWLDPEGRFKWLERNEDYIVAGVQCNVHGDIGSNGSKGSKQNLERAYTKAMTGHTHEPSIHHNLFTVGHSSLDRHGYNNGASSWVLCSGNIYADGAMELIMVINGKYKI